MNRPDRCDFPTCRHTVHAVAAACDARASAAGGPGRFATILPRATPLTPARDSRPVPRTIQSRARADLAQSRTGRPDARFHQDRVRATCVRRLRPRRPGRETATEDAAALETRS